MRWPIALTLGPRTDRSDKSMTHVHTNAAADRQMGCDTGLLQLPPRSQQASEALCEHITKITITACIGTSEMGFCFASAEGQ